MTTYIEGEFWMGDDGPHRVMVEVERSGEEVSISAVMAEDDHDLPRFYFGPTEADIVAVRAEHAAALIRVDA